MPDAADAAVDETGASPRERIVSTARIERWFVLAGLAVVPFLFTGQILARTFPAWQPTWTPDHIAKILTDHATLTGVGLMIHAAGVCLFALWGAALTAWIYRMESFRRPPILSMAHAILVAGNVVYFLLIPLAWSTAHYRAGDVSPEITQAFTDFGWFLYLGTWAPFSLQALVIAIAVKEDQKYQRLFRHGRPVIWASCAFALAGFLSAPMGLVKSGPFAWNGLLAYWGVVVTWGFWEFTITWQLLTAIGRDEQAKLAALDAPKVAAPAP